MTAKDLYIILISRGIRLWQDGSDLCFRAPTGAMTNDILMELKAKKSEVLAVVAAPHLYHPDSGATVQPPSPIHEPIATYDGCTVANHGSEPPATAAFDGSAPDGKAETRRAEVERRARGLHATDLFYLTFDLARPIDERDVYREEIHRRARAAFPDSADVKRLAAPASRFGCSHDARWLSVYGVTLCGVCHPPADPAVVAEWIYPPTGAADAANVQQQERT